MRCPACGGKTDLIRDEDKRQRYRCRDCALFFATYGKRCDHETREPAVRARVQQKKGPKPYGLQQMQIAMRLWAPAADRNRDIPAPKQ